MTKYMNLHTEWTHTALLSLSNVFEYTFQEFGEKQLNILVGKINSTIDKLTIFPKLGQRNDYLSEIIGIEIRSIKVIKEIKILYVIRNETIIIEYVKNTRQDDNKVLEMMKKDQSE